ncbi:MAG: nitrite/sulfite reductase [Gammaproteobacteria bacterium]|nr:nitrite/sulfite reductase [Gammaproteobacteria bacterium]
MNKADILVNHEEMDRYQQAVQAYLGLQLDADRFMSARLQQGVYGQRQEGVHMLRVKVPGGKMLPEQLVAIADVLETYVDHPVVHVTTRQDFQIHYVPLAHTPAAMQRLAAAGLTTREACGNTVRNITACPLAGVCPREHLDILPVMDGAVAHFLRHPLTQHLPRKFKISFSGCEHDCAQGMMHDVGVIAVKQGGRHGYKIVAGGGLGHKPHEAITVEAFIEEQDLLPSMEALVSLHHRYSDRVKRAKARIKFLVDRFGPEGFVEKYKEEYARTKAAFAGRDYPRGDWVANTPGEACGMGAPRAVFAQKQPGLSVFPISIPIGDITGPQLRGIAQLMLNEGLTDIRTTQDQNLMLMSVPNARIKAIDSALANFGLGLPKPGDDVVACPGTSTCRLGITSSKIIGAKLNGSSADLRIRASGCHNGCAQPETGDIGIYGEGKRLHGKLVPHYQMYFGGDGRAHGGLALKGPSVPAARVETAVSRVQEAYLKERTEGETFFHWTRRRGKESFTELLADLLKIMPDELPGVLHDHGEAADFKVLQLGGGECAGAAQELVSSQFAEAAYERDCRNAFASQHKYSEALECAEAILRLIGQSLLYISGAKKLDDIAEIARVLPDLRPENAVLAQRLSALTQGIDALKTEHDETAFTQLLAELDDWTRASAVLCQATDSQLDLSTSLPRPVVPQAGARAPVALIDLSSYGCPVHYMKARLELGKLASGEEIDFLLEAGDPANQVSESLAKDGHSILSSIGHGTHTRVRVQKKHEATTASQSA